MSLYPSLEDMKVDKILQSEQQWNPTVNYHPNVPAADNYSNVSPSAPISALYPTVDDYVGLDLTPSEMQIIQMQQHQFQSMVLAQSQKNEIASFGDGKYMVAPLSGNSAGLKRAQITNSIREVVLCKGKDDKVGMRCKSLNNGIFVVLVTAGSPAALAGLRFGDQLLQVNDTDVAGMTHEKLHNFIKKLPGDCLTLTVRDRPLERTVTLHKDKGGEAGFMFNNGKITSIVKDSSAAKNGLLTEHQMLEINGQNVIGLPDKKIREYVTKSENVVTLTVMPSILFEKMMQKMAPSLVRKLMDHSLFDY